MRKRRTQVTPTDSLADELQRIGFSDYEAKVYLALLQLSEPATAYEISKVAGIPRANAYSVLEILAGKRAVQPVSKSPLRYVPIEPNVLLGRIVEETTAHCNRLGKELSDLRKAGSGNDYVWALSGEFEVNAKIREMIDAAEHHIWIKAHEDRLKPHEAALREASERGVEIMIILFGTDVERFCFGGKSTAHLHEGSGIPVGVAHHLVTLTSDFSQALMVNMDHAAYGAYTSSRPVVNMAESLLRHEIYFVELFAHLSEDIERIFGPAMLSLRQRYLPSEQSDRLQNLLKNMHLDATTGTVGASGGKARESAVSGQKKRRKAN